MDKNKSIDGLMTKSAKDTLPVKKIVVEDESKKEKPVVKVPKEEPKKTAGIENKPSAPKPKARVEDFLDPVTTFNFDEKSGELIESDEPIKLSIGDKDEDEEDMNDKKNKKRKKDKKVKKKPSKKRKVITTILLIIVSLLIIAGVCLAIWGNDIIAKLNGGNLWDAIGLITETYDPLKTDENGRTNILIFGTSGYDMSGSEGNGVHDGAQLTDSIMVLSLNQESGDIVMLSLPRDLKVSSTCTATGKINEVYWCNNMYDEDEAAGAEALMAEVSDITGINLQYYIHLNWGSLVQIVDTLGGITVTLDEDIADYYFTNAVFDAGVPYTINGEQALGLARARHGTTGGDFSRGNSQQKILIAIKDKVYSSELSLGDLVGLFSVLGENIRTNLTLSEIKTAAHLTSEFDLNSMRQITFMDPETNANLYFTTGTINGISYVLPVAGAGNYTEIQAYIAESMKEPEPPVEEGETTEEGTASSETE